MFNLLNKEFTFDADSSRLDCGLNGALYFVEMEEDGGLSEYATNLAGAAYGTGYCDAQCPHDMKWIDGEANIIDWTPSDNDPNSGKGHYGTCCMEMDLWEANSKSQAYTAHACTTNGQVRCEGKECGDNETGDRWCRNQRNKSHLERLFKGTRECATRTAAISPPGGWETRTTLARAPTLRWTLPSR